MLEFKRGSLLVQGLFMVRLQTMINVLASHVDRDKYISQYLNMIHLEANLDENHVCMNTHHDGIYLVAGTGGRRRRR
jgi:hypothetical protein